MRWKRSVVILVAAIVGGTAVFAVTPLGRDLLFHLAPMRWTGEADRLAAALKLGTGASVADVGAGDGALIVELARVIGTGGMAYASERTAGKRQRIAARAASNGVAVHVIEAGDLTTGLPDACCDAITMRMVWHHIADGAAFARDLRRSVRPGGRIGVIDFAPGALPHLADDHGVAAADIESALAAAGFSLVMRNGTWGGRSYLLVFERR